MAWQPILDGELAKRARSRLVEIAAEVARGDGPPADAALFWSHAASLKLVPEAAGHAAAAYERFARAIEQVFERGPQSLGLEGGLIYLAWVAAHVADDVDDLLSATDDAVLAVLREAPNEQLPYDLHSGLVGFGSYLLARGDAACVETGLAYIVDHLAARAQVDERGTFWRTPATGLPREIAADWPDGVVNCGVAHGTPGAIALLSRIAMRAGSGGRAAALRDSAVRWLLSWQQSDGSFPLWVAGDRCHGSREAWCYGRPGIAAALTGAIDPEARTAIDDGWIGMTPERASIEHAGLCHGAAGLGHLANCVYQKSGRHEHLAAARRWLELSLRLPIDGPALAELWNGVVGVGLVLIAALDPDEPAWHELLFPGGL